MPDHAAVTRRPIAADGAERRRAWLALGFTTLSVTGLRLALAPLLPLAPDEAYYWSWSRDLSLTYFDHPPLVAWLTRVGTMLAGHNGLGVRLAPILLGAAGLLVCYRIARAADLARPHAVAAAALATLLPIPAAGSLLNTPDSPLGLCWLLAALALIRLLGDGPARYWYLLGIAAALALLSKLSGLLIPALVVAALGFSPHLRSRLRTPHPWLAGTLALVIALPYLIAEAGCGFPAVRHQLAHLTGALPGGAGHGLPSLPERLGGLLGGQLGLLTPLTAVFGVYGCFRLPAPRTTRAVLRVGLLAPLAVTVASAWFTQPEQGWAALGHPLAAIVAVGAIAGRWPTPSDRPRLWIGALLLTAAAITSVIQLHAWRPFLPLPPERDPVSRLHGWEPVGEVIADRRGEIDAISCDNYGLAALLEWGLRRADERLPICAADRPCALPAGRWLIIDERGDWGDARADAACESRAEQRGLELRRADGSVLRRLDLWLGRGCAARPAVPCR